MSRNDKEELNLKMAENQFTTLVCDFDDSLKIWVDQQHEQNQFVFVDIKNMSTEQKQELANFLMKCAASLV